MLATEFTTKEFRNNTQNCPHIDSWHYLIFILFIISSTLWNCFGNILPIFGVFGAVFTLPIEWEYSVSIFCDNGGRRLLKGAIVTRSDFLRVVKIWWNGLEKLCEHEKWWKKNVFQLKNKKWKAAVSGDDKTKTIAQSFSTVQVHSSLGRIRTYIQKELVSLVKLNFPF